MQKGGGSPPWGTSSPPLAPWTHTEIEENKNFDINELKENVPDENQFSDPKIVADCSTMTNISEKTEDESKEPNGESVDRKDVERSVDGDLGLDTVQDDWDDLDIVDQKASDVDKHTAFKKLKQVQFTKIPMMEILSVPLFNFILFQFI